MAKTPSNLKVSDLLLVNRGADSYNVTIDSTADKVIELMVIFAAQKAVGNHQPATGVAADWNRGQLWYNSTNGLMYVYDTTWKQVGGTDISNTASTTPVGGDFWVKESSQELQVRNEANTKWVGVPYISGLDHLPV